MRKILIILLLISASITANAQSDTLSITLENIKYPYPVNFMPIKVEGQDKTIADKALLSDEERAKHGLYKTLGPETAKKIPGCKLIEFDNCGHIPHIEVKDAFFKALTAIYNLGILSIFEYK